MDFHLLSPVPPTPGTHINFWLVCIIAGCVLCAVLGIIIGAPTLRLRGDYLALVTLGFGEVITQFFRNSNDIAGVNVANGDGGHLDHRPDRHRSVRASSAVPQKLLNNSAADNVYKILVLGLLVGFCLFVSLRIREGRLGRAWLAIREDELAASMMGVPLVQAKLLRVRGRRVLRWRRRCRQRLRDHRRRSRRRASTSASPCWCC